MNILKPAILRNASSVRWTVTLGLGLIALITTAPFALGQTSEPKPESTSSSQPPSKPIHAKASWYGPGLQGRETSTGETFDPHKLTAASSKLPLGSTAEVKNLQNGRTVKVKVNDCGPNVAGRKVDLSSRAAEKLKMKRAGVVPVEVKVLHKPADAQPCESQ